MIEFESVTKRYPDGTVAVDELDLTAPSGRITVFVGPSGCGKTTSLRMINRMVEPSDGRILIDGEDTGASDPATLRRGIGYVIQHAGLFPHRTVVENVATVPNLLRWNRRDAANRAHELLGRVGLSEQLADRYPAQLSGGQQQRVGVARALAADPPVMLMDEPFSAVDPVVREGLQDEFLRLQEELDKTIVFVTHDIDEAVKLGDQVAVFRAGGHLAQVSQPHDLLARPADDFVAGFVGKDRGYRALSFAAADGLALAEEPTVALGASAAEARGRALDGWILVVDDERRPQGWLDLRLLEPNGKASAGGSSGAAVAGAGEVTGELLHRGGTVANVRGSMRGVLDAALSAPSGRGVVADADGRFLGTVRAAQVLERIESIEADTAGVSSTSGVGAGNAGVSADRGATP